MKELSISGGISIACYLYFCALPFFISKQDIFYPIYIAFAVVSFIMIVLNICIKKTTFWLFENISIACFICFCYFPVFITDDISHPINIIFALVSVLTMARGICSKETKTNKKIGMIFLHLLIYAIVFFLYAWIIISIQWGMETLY